MIRKVLATTLAAGLFLTGCGAVAAQPETARLTAVATTPILADLVRQVAGDRMKVVSLVPPGADPHSYEPSLRSVRDVVHADVAFSNYLMLEPHSVVKVLDANLRRGAPNVSLAEASTHHGAEVIPLVENHKLETLWLGLRVRGEGRQRGADRSSEVEFQMTGVSGPGALVGYLTTTFGQPRVFTNSADGFDARDGFAHDSMRLPADAHTHMSWAFSKPGVYRASVRTRLINAGSQPAPVNEGTVTFVVGQDPRRLPEFAGRQVLESGHADITTDLDSGAMYLWADPAGGGERTQRPIAVNEAVVWVPPKAMTEVPAGPAFRILGHPGDAIYQLPQAVLGAHVHGEIDPHLWLDVRNVKAYARTIEETLAQADPQGATVYAERARNYARALDELDAYVSAQIASIPPASRHLITTHDAYGYLAKRYGLKIAGFVAPNPAVEPSMAGRRTLVETMRSLEVPAVFLEPTLAKQASVLAAIADEEHVQICPLYSDTLDAKVPTYVDLMRFDASSLARCLGRK